MAEGASGRLQLMRLAVLGHPIAHSKSPALHAAAYAALGLPWVYEAIDVTSDALPAFIESRDAEWRGLSLTMPLKRDVMPFLGAMDEFTELTGGANTVLFDTERRMLHGFNTDVYGVTESFRAAGVHSLSTVRLLGGGATASSVLVAVTRLGARRVVIATRAPEKLGPLIALAEQLELELGDEPLTAIDRDFVPDAVVSTLPNGVEIDLDLGEESYRRSVLFDVAYEPWPTALAANWIATGGTVIRGLEMLAHQALIQVRIFVNGHPDTALDDEAAVFAAMRAAVDLPN
ncbi:shikimate dehydrogenase [Glaciihabitans sp. UYNi722]|uniref:shikimate dehydrogenase family protein n=1 Tax=Glaciihabitans sp. UYNi722 TaxID=3156344 RepID=UPI003392E587